MTGNELKHLPKDKIKELETITERIKETGMASMIILYGSYARGDWKEHVGGRSGKRSDYDLLVLTKDERDCEDLNLKLQKMFENFPTVVQVIVEPFGYVNMQIRERQYFFTEIKEQGIILYSDERSELADAENLSPTRMREVAEYDFKEWFGTAKENYDVAEYTSKKYVEKNNIKAGKKAAFELQQCVENCYTAIEMVYIRNNPYEHRLSILRMNAQRYVSEVDKCFPENTDEERRMFFHLDRAYIGGRYLSEEFYSITLDQLEYWKKEANKLLEITEKWCQKRIKDLRGKEIKEKKD